MFDDWSPPMMPRPVRCWWLIDMDLPFPKATPIIWKRLWISNCLAGRPLPVGSHLHTSVGAFFSYMQVNAWCIWIDICVCTCDICITMPGLVVEYYDESHVLSPLGLLDTWWQSHLPNKIRLQGWKWKVSIFCIHELLLVWLQGVRRRVSG